MQSSEARQPRVRVSQQAWGTSVELAAPHVRNALDPEAVTDLRAVLAGDDPGVLLLRARGPVFCAGGDVAVLARAAAGGDLASVLAEGAAAFADLVEAVLTSPRPVVAMVDGPAVGGGLSLLLACDVRLATPRARLVPGWGRWGLPPDGGARVLLATALGAAAARSVLVEATEVGTDSPLSPLLFTRVVAPERLEEEAAATVTTLAASPGARTAKAAAAGPLLAALRAQREEEIAALVRAAAQPSVAERLAVFYKIET